MIKLKTLWELKEAEPSDEMVHVESVNRYFRCLNGEWIEKLYYTRKEIAMITGQSHARITHILRKLGLRFKGDKNNSHSNADLILVIKALKKVDVEKKTFDQVREEMGLKYHDQ